MNQSSSAEINAYVQKLVTYAKQLIQNIFKVEYEQFELSKIKKACNVYQNKNSQYGYNDDIDFKHYVITLKSNLNCLNLIQNQEDKTNVKNFLNVSLDMRNAVWHNKIKNDKSFYLNFGLYFQKVLLILANHADYKQMNIVDKRYFAFVDKYVKFMQGPEEYSNSVIYKEEQISNEEKEKQNKIENTEPHSPTDAELDEYFE